MRRGALVAVGVLLEACGAPSPRMFQPEVREPVLEARADADAAAPIDAAVDASPNDDNVKTPVRPVTDGCSFANDHADVNVGGTKERGLVSHPAARARVWLGKDGSWIEFETRDVKVAGVTDYFALFPKKPTPVTSCCALAENTALYPKVVDATHVELTFAFGDKQDRSVQLACDDLVFGRPGGRATPQVDGWVQGKNAVVLAKPTPLSETIDGPPVSAFEFRRKVRVLETKNGRARIGWERDHATYVGWVPSNAIAPESTSLEQNGGRIVVLQDMTHGVTEHLDEHPLPPPPWPRLVCDHELPLVAVWVEHYAWRIGTIKAGTPLAFAKYPTIARHKMIERGVLDVAIEEKTELHVPISALGGCRMRDIDGKVIPTLNTP